MAVVFSKQRYDFECKTIEQFKNIPKPEHSKKYVFWLHVLKMWC